MPERGQILILTAGWPSRAAALPETTYLQGAPGIGSTLLRLHRHLAGDPWTVDWPHAPAWTGPA
jgi:hypothetical protein